MQQIHKHFTLPSILAIGLASAATAGSPANLPAISEAVRERITAALPENAPAKPKMPRRILVLWKCNGYYHGAIPVANQAIELLGQKTGAYAATMTDDMHTLSADNLAKYDAILLNNTTGLVFTDESQKTALRDFVKQGKGLIGIHAATDNFYDWPEGASMLGGLFDGHPWGAGGTWAVKLDEPKHPVTASFGGKGFNIRDEIYQIKGPYSRTDRKVLLSLDLSDPTTAARPGKRDDKDYAIAWIKPFGKGRVFYSSLGHNDSVFQNAAVLGHYLAGIQYALGDLEADDTPSVKE